MNPFDSSIIYPRLVAAMFGVLLYFVYLLRSVKNTIDAYDSKSERQKKWQIWKRKHWEDFVFAPIISALFIFVVEFLIILYDAWKGTDYDRIFKTAGADIAVSFLIGAFGTRIYDKLYGKANKQIDGL